MPDQLTIIAPGLLGASVARAAYDRGLAKRIIIWARRPEVRLQIAEQPWCTDAPTSLAKAVTGSNMVIIAAPVTHIIGLAQEIASHLSPGTVVTDVGSVKGEISRLGQAALGPRGHFVGSHPMAGSEKTGWEHGDAKLFEKRTCFVTPLPETDPTALDTVARFWHNLGSDVVTMAPDQHDEVVANISHLPQVIASMLCAYLNRKDLTWRNYAGGGLRDTTRIAGSDPQLWRTILEQNRDEVLRALREFQDELQAFHAALSNRDLIDVTARLERGRAYRREFRP